MMALKSSENTYIFWEWLNESPLFCCPFQTNKIIVNKQPQKPTSSLIQIQRKTKCKRF